MTHLSLRIRVFLMFCGYAFAAICVVAVGLWMGWRQVGDGDAISGFVTSGMVAAFGILGLSAGVWLLFDDHVSKPIETIAASLRVKTHSGGNATFDSGTAQYLGDLGPAVVAAQNALDKALNGGAMTAHSKVALLRAQRDQLVTILSDIPIATLLISADHQIVLYDGQAANLMERVGAAKLKTSVFDYLVADQITGALAQLKASPDDRSEIAVQGHCGETYHGYIRMFGEGRGYTLMLEPHALAPARPMTYDFDLLRSEKSTHLDSTPLSDLVFVVFDTETTGLDPQKDDVVQLGALRIVNAKIVGGEILETLVNPGRLIPSRSTDVHGITDAMVSDAPDFAQVCDAFHRFSQGAVLVAHNAPFDMAFLDRGAKGGDITFDNPVLDTVLLSAVTFGGIAIHTLDAICDRLDITIPADLRHTAMGDAVATGRAFLAMLKILEGRGLTTFGALHAETAKHRRILKG
ncbi:MAG: 3'-5' exonuclease [Yoonia sp.]|uniref:3'-5' exonuclease n=1 Tax=Yoonia sp. TaxID=2212373 RepID=UPI0032647848